MLVYLASYPRCGHSWIRTLLSKNWNLVATHDGSYDIKGYQNGYPGFNFQLDADSRFAIYFDANNNKYRRMWMPGQTLDKSIRAELADSEELFFIKTHGLPQKKYLPGEKKVQIIRHPGGALVSYCKYINAYKNTNISLREVIQGNTPHGCWSQYHRLWSEVDRLVIRYEDLHKEEPVQTRLLGKYLNLTEEPTHFGFLQQERQRNPARYPDGTLDGWLQKISTEELTELWSTHGEVASLFGYNTTNASPFMPGENPKALHIPS